MVFINKDDYMKQTNKLKMIAAMAVSVIGVLFVTSCSNDELFGFDDYYMDDNNKKLELSNIKQSITIVR